MSDKPVAADYRNPSSIYKLPIDESQIVFGNDDCVVAQKDDMRGYQCGDTFLMVHESLTRKFLLVPASAPQRPVTVTQIEADGKPTKSALKPEVLMTPIEGDFVDVHGKMDCR